MDADRADRIVWMVFREAAPHLCFIFLIWFGSLVDAHDFENCTRPFNLLLKGLYTIMMFLFPMFVYL